MFSGWLGSAYNRFKEIYTSRDWKLRVFKGSYPDGDRFTYHDPLGCDCICTTIDTSVMVFCAGKATESACRSDRVTGQGTG